MRNFYLLLLIFLSSSAALGSEQPFTAKGTGIPYMSIWTNDDYDAGEANRSILQSSNGTIYIGNHGGLMRFDSQRFEYFSLGITQAVMNLRFNDDESVLWMTGSQDLGYYEKDDNGYYQKVSLRHLLPPEYRVLNTSPSIALSEYATWYAFRGTLYEYLPEQDTIHVHNEIQTPNGAEAPGFIQNFRDNLILFTTNGTVLEKSDDDWQALDTGNFAPANVTASKQYGDSLWIADRQLGLFTFNGETFTPVPVSLEAEIYPSAIQDFAVLHDGRFAIATQTQGTFIFYPDGRLQHYIGIETGHPENYHNSLFVDDANDLWIGGRVSLSVIHTGIPVYHFRDEVLQVSETLANYYYQDTFYFGLGNRMMRLDEPISNLYKKDLSEILYHYNETTGDIRHFAEINGHLYTAAGNGLYRVEPDALIQITNRNSRRIYQNPVFPDRIYVSGSDGLYWLSFQNELMEFQGKIEELDYNITSIVFDESGHMYFGTLNGPLINVIINDDGTHHIRNLTKKLDLPDYTLVEPVFIEDQLFLYTQSGFYELDLDQNTYRVIQEADEHSLPSLMAYFKTDYKGRMWTWYRDAGLADVTGGRIHISADTVHIEHSVMNVSNEQVIDYLFMLDTAILGSTYTSTFSIDLVSYPGTTTKNKPVITSLWPSIDQDKAIYFSGKHSPSVELDRETHNFRVLYGAASYRASNKNRYRYRIDRYQEVWSAWSDMPWVDLSNLWPGTYTLEVQSRNYMHTVSEPATIKIRVIPPWYLSYWAYGGYGLLFFLIILFSARKISDYRIHQQLQEMKAREADRLKELDEVKTRMMGNISHELRTPLTLTLGPLYQLTGDSGFDAEMVSEKVNTALRNGKRLQTMVDQILDLTRLEHNKLFLRLEMIDLKDQLSKMIESFSEMTSRKHITLNFTCNADHIELAADQNKLDKVFLNLISNAVKFTGLHGNITVNLTDLDDTVEISISDDGRGIRAENLEHIFDRFYSTKDKTEYGEGMGLGLALSKEFVGLHGGELTVQSNIGEGSTFTVRLKKGTDHYNPEITEWIEEPGFDEESPVIPLDPKHQAKRPSIDRATLPLVLIVEDNPEMSKYVTDILKSEYRTASAVNGVEGLELARELRPDVIITDIMMPEMDGFEFSEKIIEDDLFKDTPILILSALSALDDRIKGFRIGVSEYLNKPFNPDELLVRLQNLLLLKEMRNEQAALSSDETEILEDDTNEFISDVRQHVEQNLNNANFTVDDLLAHFYMSRSQFYRNVQSSTGFTPAGLIKEIRLLTALHLLESGNTRNISETANEVGFRSSGYFARTFEQRFGKHPKEYLK